jgi:hypothetical protein
MTINAGVGTSHHHNPIVAGREAAKQALRNAEIAKPDFVAEFERVSPRFPVFRVVPRNMP